MNAQPRRLMMLSAALKAAGGGLSFPVRERRTFPSGPCKLCDKPNVRRGRETGEYCCEFCYKLKPVPEGLTVKKIQMASDLMEAQKMRASVDENGDGRFP